MILERTEHPQWVSNAYLVGVMRQAVEAARMGWGTCCVTGVAGKGETSTSCRGC